ELMWNRGVEAMYRVHPQPTPDQWDKALREIIELDGVSVPSSSFDDPRKVVNAALEEAPDRMLSKIQRAVLKVMPRAKYMNDPFGGHHALNFDIYGHFTSPIRRLSDLVNHWIVHENDVPENLIELCDHASDRQKDGETVERLYKQFMEEQHLNPYDVNSRGLVVVDDEGNVVSEDGTPPEDEVTAS
ncbi:MAG: RNB domain-containing ribonuclease, partial [Salinigranum sp.]